MSTIVKLPERRRRRSAGAPAGDLRVLTRQLFGRALKLSRAPSDAWDLVQDAFERALRYWPGDITSSDARRWLGRVLANLHIDGVRFAGTRLARRDSAAILDRMANPEQPDVPRWRLVDGHLLYRALQQLPPMERRVVMMQLRDRLSLREIAEKLGLKLSTAGVKAHRARAKLRVLLLQALDSDLLQAA